MNIFDNLYTMYEIAINHNIDRRRLAVLNGYMQAKDLSSINEKYPELKKFIPYCKWYIYQEKNVLAMSAYIYDLYKESGFLPDLKNYDLEPDVEKLEHWEYVNPFTYEINPNTGFEFAERAYGNVDVWNLFLAGSARMDYYEGKKNTLEQRIKYAIVEYMTRRPQFYNLDDFVENKVLKRKVEVKDNGL